MFFGGLILYLGFWGLDLEMWSIKKVRKQKQPKRTKKHVAYKGANPVLPQGEGPLRVPKIHFILFKMGCTTSPLNSKGDYVTLFPHHMFDASGLGIPFVQVDGHRFFANMVL